MLLDEQTFKWPLPTPVILFALSMALRTVCVQAMSVISYLY